MRILVTGGAGYIGSVLTGELLAAGHHVHVLDNLMYRQPSLFQYCAHPCFEFTRGDARDPRVLEPLVREADLIIPLAAIVGAKACDRDPDLTTSTNLGAVQTLLELRDPGQPVIFPCTNSGYGTKSGEVYCTEDTPLEPISTYGTTKVAAERAVLDAGNSITLRFATVFGISPRMRLDLLVNDFVFKAVTDGYLVLYEKDFKRNYIHIRDVAGAFLHAMDHFDAMEGEPYNAGLSSANLSKEELALHIKEQVPSLYIHEAGIGEDPDKRNYIVSNEKIERTGFVARHSLDAGIAELIRGYRMITSTAYYNA